MLDKLLLLVKVSRPLSWPLVALLFILGFVISGAPISAIAIANLFAVSFLLPLVVFGINDIYDYATDSANKRKKSALHGGVLEKGNHKLVSACALAATGALAILSALTKNPTNILATALAIFIAWAYSEPPLRFKEKPVVDSLSNAALVLSVIIIGYSYGGALASLSPKVYFASLGAAAIHAVGAIMDCSADKKAGIKTVATFLGKRFTAAFALALVLAVMLFSGIRSLSLRLFFWYSAAALLVLIVKDDERLAKKLFAIGFLVALLSLSLFIYQQFFK